MTGVGTRGRRATAAILVLAVAFLAEGLVPRAADAASAQPRDRMLALTNQDRSEHDKIQLALDAQLSRYAKQHSRQMADKGYLFHTTDLAAKLKGRDWSVGGENVGVASTLASLEKAFMRSKNHRKNILRKGFDFAAVGVFKKDGDFWVTVIFYG
ncbi:MAG: CAP domain-containing protein [Actinomycetota bacterium]